MPEKKIASFKNAAIYRVGKGKDAVYRLIHNGVLVAVDRSFYYLNQIMYQIG